MTLFKNYLTVEKRAFKYEPITTVNETSSTYMVFQATIDKKWGMEFELVLYMFYC